jgi:hypothetical protein
MLLIDAESVTVTAAMPGRSASGSNDEYAALITSWWAGGYARV